MDSFNAFPWYDSQWHSAYARARLWLEENHRQRLGEFDEMLYKLQTPENFKPIQCSDFLTEKELEQCRKVVTELSADELVQNEKKSFGRDLVRHHPLFSELQKKLLPRVSELVGEELEVSYNFLSLYNKTGNCPVHMDSAEAKWTLDICLDQNAVWPIQFSKSLPWPTDFADFDDDWENRIKSQVEFESAELEPGDGVIFSGSGQWHYRDPLAGDNNFCHLIFFHYTPKDFGIYMHPKIWAYHMGLPELERAAHGTKQSRELSL